MCAPNCCCGEVRRDESCVSARACHPAIRRRHASVVRIRRRSDIDTESYPSSGEPRTPEARTSETPNAEPGTPNPEPNHEPRTQNTNPEPSTQNTERHDS